MTKLNFLLLYEASLCQFHVTVLNLHLQGECRNLSLSPLAQEPTYSTQHFLLFTHTYIWNDYILKILSFILKKPKQSYMKPKTICPHLMLLYYLCLFPYAIFIYDSGTARMEKQNQPHLLHNIRFIFGLWTYLNMNQCKHPFYFMKL